MNPTQLLSARTMRIVCGIALFASVGCFRSAGSITVDATVARDACETFLVAWQEGKTIEDLKPEIIGSDYIWTAGHQLVAFEILPTERSDGTNVHIPATLTLKNKKGAELRSKVSYAVGTSPVVTVIRDSE